MTCSCTTIASAWRPRSACDFPNVRLRTTKTKNQHLLFTVEFVCAVFPSYDSRTRRPLACGSRNRNRRPLRTGSFVIDSAADHSDFLVCQLLCRQKIIYCLILRGPTTPDSSAISLEPATQFNLELQIARYDCRTKPSHQTESDYLLCHLLQASTYHVAKKEFNKDLT